MIYCVLGPTASGKSDLADSLKEMYDAIVINFDAFQVYKQLNKGTAKPPKETLNSGDYYLYDFVDIDKDYDVSKYQNDARELINKFKDKKNIILVGGTGLYLKAALFNYQFKEEEKMPLDYKNSLTNEELFNDLLKIDPLDANKIGPNNRKRLLRALYIYEIHGKSKTELNENGKDTLLYDSVKFIGLNPDRELLYKNIELRTEKMFENGLEEEVKDLINKYDKNLRALQAIGYKEFMQYPSLEEIKNKIILNTKHYAKRQMTFFLHQFTDVMWFKSKEEALEYLRG